MNPTLAGALAALASAACWAGAAVLFSRLGGRMEAGALNLFKGLIVLVLLLPMVGPQALATPTPAWFYLVLGGILGIAVGDSLYFLALRRLGARLTLLIGTLIPLSCALAGWLWWEERLSVAALAGLALTLTGVTWVLTTGSGDGQGSGRLLGLVIALAFVVTESGGILLTRLGAEDLSALEAVAIRTLAAVAGLGTFALARGLLPTWSAPLAHPRTLTALLMASLLGAFLGTWLSIIALQRAPLAVAATLNSTAPLFVLPLSAWLSRERISPPALGGTLLAVVGLGLYFFNAPSN